MKLPRAVFIGRCCMCDRVIVGDPSPFRHLPPMPRNAGTIDLSFGYGSRHDVHSFDGLICDDCTDQFKDRMVPQTRERIASNRARMIRHGARFATMREIRFALKEEVARKSRKKKP